MKCVSCNFTDRSFAIESSGIDPLRSTTGPGILRF
jgi:hypothetical protein